MSNKKKSKNDIYWEEGSTNIFADLEMPDAEEKLAKAKLALKINDIIAQKKTKANGSCRIISG